MTSRMRPGRGCLEDMTLWRRGKDAGTYLAVLENTPALHRSVFIEGDGGRQVEFGLLLGRGIRFLLRAKSFADADGGGNRRDEEEADDHDGVV